jgi:type II pantothenate kinase
MGRSGTAYARGACDRFLMGIVLGIDIGGSTTKIVGFTPRTGMLGELQVKAVDQITSMYGAIGHFLRKYKIDLGKIEKIILTGVGASFFNEDIFGIHTVKTDEFLAIGYGGLYLAGMDEAFVVSMGTGTAFVRASADGIKHIGGSGVGGGTLLGLSSIMLNKNNIEAILHLAENGNADNVDLLVKDIFNYDIPSLPPNLTAANFGNVRSTASDADIAVGIINMIIQTIGMLAAFASKNDAIKNFIMTGALTTLPNTRETFEAVGKMHGVNFIIPRSAVFATAIGAALSHINKCVKQE